MRLRSSRLFFLLSQSDALDPASLVSGPRGYGYLLDQMRRAMASVVLNIAEGNARRSSSERRRFFEVARASAAEVGASIDLMGAFRLVTPEGAVAFKSQLEEISKMLWGLMR